MKRSQTRAQVWVAASAVTGALMLSAMPASAVERPLGGLRVVGGGAAGAASFSGPEEITTPPGYPVAGFQPTVALRLTDRQASDPFQFTSSIDTSPTGNPINPAGGGTIVFATLDSGGQSHVLSGDLYSDAILAGAGRAGTNFAQVLGAGGVPLDVAISDPLGVYVAPLGAVGPGNSVPSSAFRGQYNTSILTTPPGTQLPNILGLPMFGQYQIQILNSQTVRRTSGSTTYRAPTVNLLPLNSTINTTTYPTRSVLDLLDPLNSATSPPAFIPDLSGGLNFLDNPTTPTFWTFPFVNTTVTHSLGSVGAQQFLFDTGAQVTVLSEQLAADIGFDASTQTPDFTVQVSGIGGIVTVPGFVMNQLRLSSTGGTLSFNNVPVVVLDITDPRDGVGFVPGIIGMNLFNDRDMVINMSPSNPIVRFSNTFTAQWNTDASGTWSPDANWLGGVPDGQDLPANFLGTITAPRTVTVDAGYTVGRMKFDNLNSYTLSGPGSIAFSTFLGPTQLSAVSGQHTIATEVSFGSQLALVDVAPVARLTLSGDSASPAARLRVSGGGTLEMKHARVASLDVTAGTVRLLPGAGNASTSRVGTLTIAASGASVDLSDAKLIVDYTGASPLASVRADVLAGKLGSGLLGSGRGVGYAEAADVLTGLPGTWFGQPVDATAVLVRLTLLGDADLDGSVSIGDFSRVAAGFNQAGFWSAGDFDGNGTIGIGDFSLLAANFNQSLPGDLPRAAAVPEPASGVVLGALAGLLIRRRR